MGTGTAYARFPGGNYPYWRQWRYGGTPRFIRAIISGKNIETIDMLARQGDLHNVDLFISEITKSKISSLPPDVTASNLGRIKNTATKSDLALGLLNMIFQTVGMLAVFACRNDTIKDVVFTGALTVFPQARTVFAGLREMYGLNFIIPEKAVFATAIGATIPYLEEKK